MAPRWPHPIIVIRTFRPSLLLEVLSELSIIGCGRLGAPYAAGMAIAGNEGLGLDVAPTTVCTLSAGCALLDEPGLAEAIADHTTAGTLRFTTAYDEVAAFADLHILCVGTP
ncbi:hypothetical protein [Planotetraspora sp. GP83]|uniref:hypothetical protein n=1 Tax=Planotetraspora sp. GP83 TaxID=3156264 RepID=UPI003513BE44